MSGGMLLRMRCNRNALSRGCTYKIETNVGGGAKCKNKQQLEMGGGKWDTRNKWSVRDLARVRRVQSLLINHDEVMKIRVSEERQRKREGERERVPPDKTSIL